jgi:hypothetical protein
VLILFQTEHFIFLPEIFKKEINVIFSANISNRVVTFASNYIGRAYNWYTFNCIHFVESVYREVGITIPRLDHKGFPPKDLHLSVEEFAMMPIGHTVFFKRKANLSGQFWTHLAIIFSSTELIHCSWYFGGKVTVTKKINFMEIYDLTPKA